MTRLSLVKNIVTGVFASRKPMMSNLGFLTVTINVDNKTFTVNKYEDNQMVGSGTGINYTMLKRNAKHALKAFGVHFNDEVRAKQDAETPDEVVNG